MTRIPDIYRVAGLSCLAACFVSLSTGALAHSEHAQHAQHAAPKAAESVALQLPDAPLVDQAGRKVRLKSDVLGDNIVVMDFVYTSCTTVCPVVSAILAQVQEQLGSRAGSEVKLVSLTIDPVRDTPARLKSYAAKHGAGPGWAWLTGTQASVNDVLKGVGTYTPNFEEHPAVILVGDARTGQWSRYYGFADPRELLARVEALAAERRLAAPRPAVGNPPVATSTTPMAGAAANAAGHHHGH